MAAISSAALHIAMRKRVGTLADIEFTEATHPRSTSIPESATIRALERLRETATRVLGTRTWPALVCYRIRYGVK